jgi:uncharacterized metal-binding protein YceD (DUF177 family)
LIVVWGTAQEVCVTQTPNNGYVNAKVLRMNVGFILAETIGFNRETEFNVPSLLKVADDLTVGHFYATLRMSKTRDGLLIQGTVETSVFDECSRCTDDMWIPIEFQIEELFATNDNLDTEYRVDETGILDLAPLVREEAMVNRPMTTPTNDDGRCMFCNRTMQDVMRDNGLLDGIDPRFEALRVLREQMEAEDKNNDIDDN